MTPIKTMIAAGALILAAAPAFAADLGGPPAEAPRAAEQPLKWSGPYAGVHLGYARGDVSVLDDVKDGVTPGPFGYHANGGFGGLTLGYNWQAGSLVYGLESDLGYMNLTGHGIIPSSNPAAHQDITLDGGWYGDLTGRLGFAVDRTLFYAKGGGAFYTGQAKQATTNPGYVPTGTGTFTGWTYGGGIEHFITPTLSLRAEYLHFDFGKQGGYQTNVGDLSSPIGYRFHNWTSLDADTFKVGLAVHW